MATFGLGSAQLIEVKVFENSGSGAPNGILYTTPSGRYAEVFAQYLPNNGNVLYRYNYGGTFTYVTPLVAGVSTPVQALENAALFNEGDQIEINTSNRDYIFIIKEYKKP